MKRKEAIEVLETIRIGSSYTEHEAIDKAVKALKNIKKEYNRGLKDAWECTKKILDMDDKKLELIFGMKFFDGEKTPIDIFTAQEAIQKIKDYELIEQHYYEERQTTNLCDKCAKTKCSVKMQLEEQNIKLKGCDFYEDKENK